VIYVLVAAAALVAVGVLMLGFRRPPKDDVERFHRARAMTTEWSQRYAATGHLDLPSTEPAEPAAAPSAAKSAKSAAKPVVPKPAAPVAPSNGQADPESVAQSSHAAARSHP
jgi:nucleoid-associated protein YgaU